MSTSTDRIDQLALVWLLVPRKESRISGFHPQLKSVANGADDQRRLASESIARLRERGMIERGNLLKLTDEGRRSAIETLGLPGIPEKHKKKLEWAKKVLLLRSIEVEPTNPAIDTAGQGGVLAARILIRQHKLDARKLGTDASKVVAVLARRALGLKEKPEPFKFDEVFVSAFLGASTESDTESAPASGTVSLNLAARDLPDFARIVTEAARSSATGRWHGAVFISHVWSTLCARGKVGITLEKFKRRLIEAYQKDLIELSRADLVDAMPAEDVSASETTHSGARFHFVRLEQLAS